MGLRLPIVCVFVGMAVVAGPRAASADEATDAIRDAESELRGVFAEKPEQTVKIQARLRTLFDVEQVARAALERHWSSMTADQRDEIVELLRALIERRYIDAMRAAFENPIEYRDSVTKDGTTRVRTVITEAGKNGAAKTVEVDYVMRKTADGYRVEDMITDSVSMVANYRSQFNRVIKKHGFDGLLAKLRAKAAKD